MSYQIIDGNFPYPYSLLGLVFQSLICYLVLVSIQSLVHLQNLHRTNKLDAAAAETSASENGVSTPPTAHTNKISTRSPQVSAESIESSVPAGATGDITEVMSEDRHTLSQPRFLPPATPQAETAVAEARLMHPKLTASESSSHKKNQRPYEGPVFLVDVFRAGVDDPVDTVVITDETLPPRKNRKGKVAWRLPDLESAKGGRLPSFASDERKRILDLFKERKRNRKKLLKKTSSTASSVVGGQSVAESSFASAASAPATAEAEPAAISSGSQGWSRGRIKTADGNNDAVAADASASAAAGCGEKDVHAATVYDPEESLESPSTKSKKRAAKRGGKKNRENGGTIGTRGSENKENGDEEKSGAISTNVLSPMSNDVVQSENSESIAGQDVPDDSSEPTLPLKSIVILNRPNLLDPNPSLSVPAAKAFIDLYYPHITSGLSDDLAMYYSPGAQKSVSFGDAHSVVTGRDSIQLQIASFVGSQFVVKSVVAQNSVSGGAFILITGVVQTSPSAGSQISSFAHSVNLIPAAAHAGCRGDLEASFLIFNDALMLMKASDPAPLRPQAPLGMGAQYESASGMVDTFRHGSLSTNLPYHPQQQQQQEAPPPGLLPPGFRF